MTAEPANTVELPESSVISTETGTSITPKPACVPAIWVPEAADTNSADKPAWAPTAAVDDWLARDNVPLTDFTVPTVADEADEAAIEPLAFLIPETRTVTERVSDMVAERWLAPDTDVEDTRETAMVPVIAFAPDAEVLDAALADMVDWVALRPEAEVLSKWMTWNSPSPA